MARLHCEIMDKGILYNIDASAGTYYVYTRRNGQTEFSPH